jgi:hypothetical protein
MERIRRQGFIKAEPDTTRPATDPALRDAEAILARAEADQVAADDARERHRSGAIPTLEPDLQVGPVLGPYEQVLAMRRHAVLDRRQGTLGPNLPTSMAGDLYVTTRRLILIGRRTLWFELAEIEDVLLSGERLLLVMRDGEGAALSVTDPRLLRVEIAAARLTARG